MQGEYIAGEDGDGDPFMYSLTAGGNIEMFQPKELRVQVVSAGHTWTYLATPLPECGIIG